MDLRTSEITSTHKKDGATHAGEYALALDAVSIRVGGAVLLQGANVKGEIFLADARIDGLRSSLSLLAVVALIALFATRRIPAEQPTASPAADPASDPPA